MGGPIGEAIVFALLRSDFLFWAATKLIPAHMTQAVLATDPAIVKAASKDEQARVSAILTHILPVSRRAQASSKTPTGRARRLDIRSSGSRRRCLR
jgi:hypothetical protein